MHKIEWRCAELRAEVTRCLEKAAEAEAEHRLTTAYSQFASAMEAERKLEALRKDNALPGLWL